MKATAVSMPDPGIPPESVQRQNEELQRILKSGEPVPGSKTDEPVEESDSGGPEPMFYTPKVNVPPPGFKSEKVDLEYVSDDPKLPGFVLTFQVSEVCIRSHYISLLLVTDMGFRPQGTVRFILRYRRQNFPVIFVGAEFEFQTVNVRGISFLIDKNRTEQPIDDQTRKSGTG